MTFALMSLKVYLPFGVFADHDDVARIVAETPEGSFGILPNRRDCVAALAPCILVYETADDREVYLGIDEGVLVKTGREVRVSVRRAVRGADLGQLREAVDREFVALTTHEQDVRAVMRRLETGFLRRLASFRHD